MVVILEAAIEKTGDIWFHVEHNGRHDEIIVPREVLRDLVLDFSKAENISLEFLEEFSDNAE
jgi:hypothetical protein